MQVYIVQCEYSTEDDREIKFMYLIPLIKPTKSFNL